MRIIFAGTPEPAVVALEKLLASSHEVVAVITRPDAKKGRGRTLHPSPVKALAQEHGIEVLTPTTLRPDSEDGQALRARLKELQPEAIPVVAYGNLVTKDLLELPQHGWVNLHFSLLPAWRGAAPVQAAIAAGDEVTGASTFRIEEGLDTGPVLGTVTEEIKPTDTADDLLTRLAYSGGDLLVATMDGLANGELEARPQQGGSHLRPKDHVHSGAGGMVAACLCHRPVYSRLYTRPRRVDHVGGLPSEDRASQPTRRGGRCAGAIRAWSAAYCEKRRLCW